MSPQLVHDVLSVHEGMRQVRALFRQGQAAHAIQLQTVMTQLTYQGLLSPDAASYIASLPTSYSPTDTALTDRGWPAGAPPMPMGEQSISPGAAVAAGATAAPLGTGYTSGVLDFGGGREVGPGLGASLDTLQARLEQLEAVFPPHVG